MREIRLYGPIGRGFDTYSGVRMLDEEWMREELAMAGGDDVELLINSDGGSVFTAKAMMEDLARYEGKVTAIVTSIAASAATFLPMTADWVLIAPGAMMMIHDPWSIVAGNERELRAAADHLAAVRESTIMPAYLERMKDTSKDELRTMLDAETWLSAEESVRLGLANGMSRDSGAKALIRPDHFKADLPNALSTASPSNWRETVELMRTSLQVAKTKRVAAQMQAGHDARREHWAALVDTSSERA